MSLTARHFMERVLALASEAASTQHAALVKAAELVCTALTGGGRFLAFGTGHSHLLVEELWGRAGGLTGVVAMLEPCLMLHEGLEKSSALERLDGLGTTLVDLHGVRAGDVVLVISNSGRNAVPVEVAIQAQARGARVIALTSLQHSRAVTPRGRSGRRLFEVADVVIDNCGVPGDAIIDHQPHAVGPTSTIVGALLLEALVVEVVGRMQAAGTPVGTYLSLNVE